MGVVIEMRQKGEFKKTMKWLQWLKKLQFYSSLDKYGRLGIEALANATPKDTGATAAAWRYNIEKTRSGVTIGWTNDEVDNGTFKVALMLQYGHGTKDGSWVKGIDYINPALRPVFEAMGDEIWEEVTSNGNH